MLFRRRKPERLSDRLRTWFWPRRSFARSMKYLAKRVLRLRGTPHSIAAGLAVGVFIAFLPIPGFHLPIAAVAAWLVSGDVVASALGSTVGNPLTWPAIWGATYELGHLIVDGAGTGPAHDPRFAQMFHGMHLQQLWHPVLLPMLAGALPLGLVAAVVCYGLTRWGTATFQRRRQLRMAGRAHGGTLVRP